LPTETDLSPANACIRKSLFLPRRNLKGKGKGRSSSPIGDRGKGKWRPSSPTGDKGKLMHDCPSNIPTIYYYDFWRDLAAAELLRRKLATKENLSILEDHVYELKNANNASDSDNDNPTMLENSGSIFDCKIDCFDSAFVLASNLVITSKGKGPKNILSGYRKARRTIVCRWLEPAEAADRDISAKDIENMIKERTPPAVWETLHQQRKWKGKHPIRDMSTDTRHEALREAYDEYIFEYAEKKLDALRNVLRDRALGNKVKSTSNGVNCWTSSLQSMNVDLVREGNKQLSNFVSLRKLHSVQEVLMHV